MKYKITKSGTNSGNFPAGTIVYDLRGHDYGIASDDTRMSGIEHVSVTLDPDGNYPSFTVVKDDLEKIEGWK